MKYVKSHYESALTDGRVQSLLMAGNTNFEPQLNVLPPFTIKEFRSLMRPMIQRIVLRY